MNRNRIIKLLILTIFTDAYYIFNVGSYGVTLFYFAAAILIFGGILQPNDITTCARKRKAVPVMIIYLLVNYLITGSNEMDALFLRIALWIIYLFSYRKSSVVDFEKTVDLFQGGMNILAIYGIYQILGRYYGLPFTDLRIENHMVKGYSWSGPVSVGGLIIQRSNATCREASFFSQFLAINILLYFQKLVTDTNSEKAKKYIGWLTINFIALVCSFSGTGAFMLLGGIAILLFTISDRNNIFKRLGAGKTILLCISLCLLLLVIVGSLLKAERIHAVINHFVQRLSEFGSSTSSGGQRFIIPYMLVWRILLQKPLMGLGVGNATAYSLMMTGN